MIIRGLIDTTTSVNGVDGLEIGIGDQVMTRQNSANRQVWTVTAVSPEGQIDVAGPQHETASLPADYVQHHVHLAYATTTHGVQGETASHVDLLLSRATDAAGAYVGLTRGRHSNTVHIVADNPEQARDQWIEAAGRNRADLGLEHARHTAINEARNYRQTPTEPVQRSQEPATETVTPQTTQRPAGGRRPLPGTHLPDPNRRSFADRMRDIDNAISEGVATADAPAAEQPPSDYDIDEHQRQHHRGPRL